MSVISRLLWKYGITSHDCLQAKVNFSWWCFHPWIYCRNNSLALTMYAFQTKCSCFLESYCPPVSSLIAKSFYCPVTKQPWPYFLVRAYMSLTSYTKPVLNSTVLTDSRDDQWRAQKAKFASIFQTSWKKELIPPTFTSAVHLLNMLVNDITVIFIVFYL